jgi:hypothetical protein
MNFKISSSRLVAAALCAVLLAGCDSIKDVRDEPYTAVPTPTGLIAGTITGLGSRRAMVLSWSGAGNKDCTIPDPGDPANELPAPCKFLGIENEPSQTFSFGSYEEGTAYNINVEQQPYGKICTVANPSGTVGSGGPEPVVTCVNDDVNFSRYDLTVNIPGSLQTLPNMKITVKTEDGTQVQDATGMASVVFPGVLFDSGNNLPLFQYFVTATYEDTAGGDTMPNSCSFVSNASFTAGGTNQDSAGGSVVPSGPITQSVNACFFTVSAAVVSLDTPTDTGPTGGLELALRNHYTGVDEQTLSVANFTGQTASVFSFGTFYYVNNTVTFPEQLRGNANSLYELVVTQQPAGMHCIVAGQTTVQADTQNTAPGINQAVTAPTASAVATIDPAVAEWWTFANRQVRCKSVPTAPNILTGTYQMDAKSDPPLQGNGNPWGRPREFLTFFEDGTFLYGIGMNTASNTPGSPNDTFDSPASGLIRGNYNASSGVTHGFYTYDSVAGTIVFHMLTATNINPAGRGLTGMPGVSTFTEYVQGLGPTFVSRFVTAENVVKGVDAENLGTLAMDFGARHWTMTEPLSIPGEISGPWITADHLRVFVYDKYYTYAFHMGANGYGNLQDSCLLPLEDSTQSSGRFSLHADEATAGPNIFVYQFTCTPGLLNFKQNYASSKNYDLPSDLPANSTVPNVIRPFVGAVPPSGLGPTTPRRPPDYHARFPGMDQQTNGRPSSPVDFDVTLGTPDTMAVQNTLNGIPVDAEIDWMKSTVN